MAGTYAMNAPAKRVACIGVLAYDGRISAGLARMLVEANSLSHAPDFPWGFKPLFAERVRPIDRARNLIVTAFLADPRAERLLFIDSDMVPPANWHLLLEHDAPAVSGLSLGWQPGRNGVPPTLRWEAFRNAGGGAYDCVAPASRERPFEVDAAGAGCLCLSRSLLERVGPRPFTIRDEHGLLGDEDLLFFLKVNALGVRCLVDPRVVFGHEKMVNLLDIVRCQEVAARVAAREATDAVRNRGR